MNFSAKVKFLIIRILVIFLRPFDIRPDKKFKNSKNIIFIRNDGLGDFLVFLPAVKIYKKYKPDHKLILFTSLAAPLAEESGLFDQIIRINHVNSSFSLKDLLRISVFPAEIFVNTLHGRNAKTDIFAMLSPARRKICFSLRGTPLPEVEKICSYERFYTETILFQSRTLIRKQHCYLAQKICNCTDPVMPPELPELPIKTGIPACLENLSAKYYVIVPGAEDFSRKWETGKFRELIARLRIHFPELHPVVTGTAGEFQTGCDILEHAESGVNLCGKLTLPELGTVLKNAEFTVGNETGGTHFSAIAGTETFVICGGGHFAIYMPDTENKHLHCLSKESDCFDCYWFCKKTFEGNYPCIRAVSVSDVEQKILEIMQ